MARTARVDDTVGNANSNSKTNFITANIRSSTMEGRECDIKPGHSETKGNRKGSLIENLWEQATNLTNCDQCDIPIKKKHELKEHMTEHEYTDPMEQIEKECTRCSSQHRTRNDFKQHMKKNHYQQFNCKQCNYLFKNEDELMEHMKEHESINQWEHARNECTICDLQHKTKKNLMVPEELKSHFGLIYISCNKCDIPIRRKNELRKHMTEHEYMDPVDKSEEEETDGKLEDANKELENSMEIKADWSD